MNSMLRIFLFCISILFMSCSESRNDKLTFIYTFESKYYRDIVEISNYLKLMDVPENFKLEFRKSGDFYFHTIDSNGNRGGYFYPKKGDLYEKHKEFYIDTWVSSIRVKNSKFVIFDFGVFKSECIVIYFYDNITSFISKEELANCNARFLNEANDMWIVNGKNENIYFIAANSDFLQKLLNENNGISN